LTVEGLGERYQDLNDLHTEIEVLFSSFFITQQSMSLKYEPASAPLHRNRGS